jgi:integrase
MMLVDFFNEWLSINQVGLQKSTAEAQAVCFKAHILPYFQKLNLSLQELSAEHIFAYAHSKLQSGRKDGKAGGLSRATVNKHLSLIRQSLDFAVCQGYIKVNPASSFHLPRRQFTKERREVFLNEQEAQQIINSLQGQIKLAVALALYYGLRRSEVLGLKWSAIDFKNKIIYINHTIVKNLTIEAKDSTKTESSCRAFQLLPEIEKALIEHKNASMEHNEYVFYSSDGGYMRPDCLTRSFQRQLRRAGFPKLRFHDLRHSTASILFDKGWSLDDVKNWLGHSDIETTSNIYLHYTRDRKIMLAKGLEGMLKI